MPITTQGEWFFLQKWAANSSRYSGVQSYYLESISVGDGTDTATVSDTDLSGTNKARRSLGESDSDISRTGSVLTLSVTFPSTAANYIWNELGLWIYNGTTRQLVYHENITDPGPAKLSTTTKIASIQLRL